MTKRERMVMRRAKVAEFLDRGISSRRFIARKLNCSLGTVQSDIEVLIDRIDRDTIARTAHAATMQLASIQWRRAELVESWLRSKEPGESTTTEDGAKGVKTSRTVKDQCGDPRYMTELEKLDVREDALLGLSGKADGTGAGSKDWRGLSREELMNRFRATMKIVPTKNQENGS